MESNPVGWFEIYVQDMARARAFYENVLAVKLDPLPNPGPDPVEMWSWPMKDGASGATGALVSMAGGPSGNGTMVYFSCDDCATEASRVGGAGGQLMKEKFSIGPYGFIAIATDTDGNAFGLHSLR